MITKIVGDKKYCTKCKKYLYFNNFYKNDKIKCGLSSYCRNCERSRYTKKPKRIITKDISERFERNKNRRNYYYKNRNREKERASKYGNTVTNNGFTRFRESLIKNRYNLSIEEYKKLLKESSGLCAICKKAEKKIDTSGKVKALCIDHDHKTGKVRGLLCSKCNHGLGNFEDNIQLLQNSISYLTNN